MLMPLATGSNWADLISSVPAGSTAVVTNDVLRLTKAASAGSVTYSVGFRGRPGQRIRVEVFARLLSGTPPNGPRIQIYRNNAAPPETNDLHITSRHFEKYVLEYVMPLNIADDDLVFVTCAIITGATGDVEFYGPPLIWASNTRQGASRKVFQGLIEIAGGVASVHPDFYRCGIVSVSYSAATKTLTVNTDSTSFPGSRHNVPSVRVDLHSNNNPTFRAIASSFDRTTGSFTVKFLDAAGAYVDIGATTYRMNVSGEGFA